MSVWCPVITNHYVGSLWLCFGAILLATRLCAADSDAEIQKFIADFIAQSGYPSDSIDGVIQATRDQSCAIRAVGVELLARRDGPRNLDVVLPVLREMMTQDPAVTVRSKAAYWVAKLGDTSGVDVLNREYLTLVPGGADPQRCGEVGKYQVNDALEIGEMLAKLGNPIGLAFGSHVARADGFDTVKFLGARILGAIAHLGKEYPEQAGQAIEVLEEMAAMNIKPSALVVILVETERPGFPPEAAERIQNILGQSGRLPSYASVLQKRTNVIADTGVSDNITRVITSQPGQRVWRPRGVRLDPPELEMPISHRESRVFHVALQGDPETCMVSGTETDDPGIEVAIRGGSDGKGYALDVTVKETTLQNRTNYVIVRLEECERPFLVLPVKYFRQATTRPAAARLGKCHLIWRYRFARRRAT